LKNFESEEF